MQFGVGLHGSNLGATNKGGNGVTKEGRTRPRLFDDE